MQLETKHHEKTPPPFQNPPELPGADADRCIRCAKVLSMQGKKEEALQYYEKAIRFNPGSAAAHLKMGVLYRSMGRLKEALYCYQKALAIRPDSANIYFNMGNTYREMGRSDEALLCYRKVIHSSPGDTEAHRSAGHMLKLQGRLDEALEYFQKALGLNPKSPCLHVDVGGVYFDQDRLEEALLQCKKALSLKPDHADAHYNRGIILEAMGRFEEAVAVYEQVLKLNPEYTDASWNRSLTLLLLGNFKEGWKGYENRIHASDWKECYPYRHGLPKWDGNSFAGKKLYIHEEQGIGDTLQFIRYLPMVKERGGTVVFETKKQMFGLLNDFKGIDLLVERMPRGETSVHCDCYVPLLSLPGIFGTTEHTIPRKVPYLFADPGKARFWSQKVHGPGYKVGIVWRGNPNHKRDKSRSCALDLFSSLATIPGIRIFGLQKGEAASEVENPSNAWAEANFGEMLHDFTDTAGLIANLDLVISVDTAVAHLAGAMAKPVWVLLPFVPDWRWMRFRNDSPWYPTMKLFRQDRPGDWASVFANVKQELQILSVKTCERANS